MYLYGSDSYSANGMLNSFRFIKSVISLTVSDCNEEMLWNVFSRVGCYECIYILWINKISLVEASFIIRYYHRILG